MEQFNRALTVFFVVVFALGVAFFIFYRLGLFQKMFPQAKLSVPWFFNSTTKNSDTTSLTPTPTPEGQVGYTQETGSHTSTQQQTQQPETTSVAPVRPVYINGATTIPNTGAPTLLLPLLLSAGGVGLWLRKKSE
jgi:hypothetical protein